jgi:hypothetical protein
MLLSNYFDQFFFQEYTAHACKNAKTNKQMTKQTNKLTEFMLALNMAEQWNKSHSLQTN